MAAAAAAPGEPGLASARVDEPRAFGYSVGDVVTRRIEIDVPAGLTLDPASVPQPGRRGKALELRSVALKSRLGGRHHELALEYQIFLAPRDVRTLEMPAFALRFEGRPREQTVRVDAWPVSVAPLVAAEAPARRGLGDFQPDAEPPSIDLTWIDRRLTLTAIVLAAALAYLATVYLGLPWWGRRQRPFAAAWRDLRLLPMSASGETRRAAFATVHAALNRSAGEVLFEPGIDRFVAAQPRFAALRADLAGFFERSRRTFFAAGPTLATGSAAGGAAPAGVAATTARTGGASAAGVGGGAVTAAAGGVAVPAAAAGADADTDATWLRDFCRRCRDVERGSA